MWKSPLIWEEINEVLTEIAEHLRKMQQQDPRLLFRGVQVKDAVLNNRVYSPDEVLLTRLGESIRHKDRKETEGTAGTALSGAALPRERRRRISADCSAASSFFYQCVGEPQPDRAAALGNELILRTAAGKHWPGCMKCSIVCRRSIS